jgi:hypothetical protein
MDGGSAFSQPSNKILVGDRLQQPGNPTMVSLVNLHTSNASPDQEASGQVSPPTHHTQKHTYCLDANNILTLSRIFLPRHFFSRPFLIPVTSTPSPLSLSPALTLSFPPPTQVINPLDPWVQLLVQDRIFIASVQTNKLHAAAAAAVKVIKTHFLDPRHQQQDDDNDIDYPTAAGVGGTNTNKRAADGRRGARGGGSEGRAGHQELHNHHHRHNNQHHEPMPPHFAGLLPALHALKQEILTLEDEIPWTLVRRAWKNKRTNWRRQLKTTENVIDLAVRLKELRQYLATDDGSFLGCGPTWQSALEGCIVGRGSFGQLFSVWDEMRNTIRSWLDNKLGGGGMTGNGYGVSGGGGAGTPRVGGVGGGMIIDGNAHGYSGGQITLTIPRGGGGVQAGLTAVRALQALQAALKYDDVDKLLQTPLEAIVGYDSQSLHAVRQAVELERRMVAARMAAIQKQHQDGGVGGEENDGGGNTTKPLVSYFSSINAAWEDSDFDSGADTDIDDGGDVTDLDAEFD